MIAAKRIGIIYRVGGHQQGEDAVKTSDPHGNVTVTHGEDTRTRQ